MGRKYLVYDAALTYSPDNYEVILAMLGGVYNDNYISVFPDGLVADIGEHYTVLWDDNAYTCEVKEYTITETTTNSDNEEVTTTSTIRCFGNVAVGAALGIVRPDESWEDTGEPFLIIDSGDIYDEERYLFCLYASVGEDEKTHRLTVYQEIEAEEYVYFEGRFTVFGGYTMLPCIRLEEEKYTLTIALPESGDTTGGAENSAEVTEEASTLYTFTPVPPLKLYLAGIEVQTMGNVGKLYDGEADETLATDEPFIMISYPDSRITGNAVFVECTIYDLPDGTYYGKLWRSAVVPNDIYLKDASGTDILYEGRESVCIPGRVKDAVYSFGEAVEKNVPLLFLNKSGITMDELVINAPTGDVFKKLIIKRPKTLLPENIANGISIAGVEGTYSDAKPEEEATVVANFAAGDLVVTPSNGNVMTKVTVQKPPTLLPENIAEGISVAGVDGAHRGGGIAEVETAEEMDALLTEDNVGKYFRYLGETTDDYTQDDIYLVEEAT